jgi:hypothetical protein
VVGGALNRLNSNGWYRLVAQAARLDQSVKGQRYQEVGSAWHQVEQLCAAICAVQVLPESAIA